MFVEEANIKSNTSREKTRIVIRSTTNNVDHLSTITNERTATRVADSGTARRQGFRHASTRYVRKGSSKMRHRWRGIRTRLMNSWVIAATSASPNSPHTRRATTPNTAIVKPSLKRNQIIPLWREIPNNIAWTQHWVAAVPMPSVKRTSNG